jgi:two-component system, sensor histidine kinase
MFANFFKNKLYPHRLDDGLTLSADDNNRLFADAMARVRHGAKGGLYGGILVVIVFAVLFRENAQWLGYWLWLGAISLHLVIRTHQLFKRFPTAPMDVQRWAQRFVVGLVFAGSLWGLCGWVLFPAAPEAGRYLIFGAQYVIAVMSVAAFSWYPRAFAAFITPLFLLMSAPWFIHNSFFAWPLLVCVVVTYFVLLDYVNRSAKVLVSSLAMRYEREALLAQLVERTAEAERANVGKTRFLASASHDLRQPLQALGLLSAHAVNLSEATTQNHAAQLNPVLQQMQNMTRVLGELVDALLDISRLDAGLIKPELQQFALQDVLDSVVDEAALVAADKGLSLRVWRTTAVIESDPIMLARIVRNLLANAIRYTQHGGILLATRQRGGHLNIEIWDTGIGIAAADQATIFDEFVQLNNPARDRSEGLGLGLAIVARLGGLLGFKISCRSRVGHGSVFTVAAPRRLISTSPASALRQDRSISIPRIAADELLAGAQLLLVEDDVAVNDATALVLRSWGCVVTTAFGFDDVAKIIADKSLQFDVIITDFRLGKYTGVEVANSLRQRYRWAIPVLVVSGEVSVDVTQEALEQPYFLLAKPVAAATLRVALTQLLRTKVELIPFLIQ